MACVFELAGACTLVKAAPRPACSSLVRGLLCAHWVKGYLSSGGDVAVTRFDCSSYLGIAFKNAAKWMRQIPPYPSRGLWVERLE